MSRITQIPTRFAVAGMLGAGVPIAPTPSHAQQAEGERALLNHITVPVDATAARALSIAADPISSDPVDGQRALLVRVTASPVGVGAFGLVVVPARVPTPVNGERALLAR
jgi:hypothetical protein